VTRQEFTATVASVWAGEPGVMLELWEGVRRFVAKSAYRWAHNSDGRIPHENLMRAGFFAMLDAVEKFDLGREDGSFLSVLCLTIKTRFSEESGIRTTKCDALQYAESADVSAYWDGLAVADTLPDDSASLAFTGVEYGDFLTYCRGIIGAALDNLAPAQAAIVRQHRLEGLTLDEVAALVGLFSKQAESQAWLKNFFSSHAELTIQEKDERIAVLRGIANRAREDVNNFKVLDFLITLEYNKNKKGGYYPCIRYISTKIRTASSL